MTDPIVEQIAKAMKVRLESVTAANGYRTTVLDVVRPSRIDHVSPRPFRVVVVQDDADENTELDYQGDPPAAAYDQPFVISMFIIPTETVATPPAVTAALEDTINVALADLHKAVMSERQWGGLAVDSRVTDPGHWEISADGYALAGIVVRVTYRVDEDDPYVNRA